MNNNISEQERKELNKKLLKRTFFSEFKNRINGKKNVIDLICTIIACFIADVIVERLQINFWFFDMVISIAIIMIILFVLEIFVQILKFKF